MSESKDIFKTVEELRNKIQDLQQENRTGLPVRAGGRGYSLDFVHSETLTEIESGIKDTIEGIALSKAALCKALANIDKKKLYLQVNANNFMEYLELARVPINYKTAKEYAKIGDTMLRYNEELTSVDFHEEDGLKKLVYLDQALEYRKDDPQEVFEKVKESSLRDFQHWVKELKEEKPETPAETYAGETGGAEIDETIDEQGKPIVTFTIKNNTLYLRTGTRVAEPVIITKPELIGVDTGSIEWEDFLEEVRVLLEDMLRKGQFPEG